MNKNGMALAIMEFSFSDTFHLETCNKQVNRLIKSFVIGLSTEEKKRIRCKRLVAGGIL